MAHTDGTGCSQATAATAGGGSPYTAEAGRLSCSSWGMLAQNTKTLRCCVSHSRGPSQGSPHPPRPGRHCPSQDSHASRPQSRDARGTCSRGPTARRLSAPNDSRHRRHTEPIDRLQCLRHADHCTAASLRRQDSTPRMDTGSLRLARCTNRWLLPSCCSRLPSPSSRLCGLSSALPKTARPCRLGNTRCAS